MDDLNAEELSNLTDSIPQEEGTAFVITAPQGTPEKELNIADLQLSTSQKAPIKQEDIAPTETTPTSQKAITSRAQEEIDSYKYLFQDLEEEATFDDDDETSISNKKDFNKNIQDILIGKDYDHLSNEQRIEAIVELGETYGSNVTELASKAAYEVTRNIKDFKPLEEELLNEINEFDYVLDSTDTDSDYRDAVNGWATREKLGFDINVNNHYPQGIVIRKRLFDAIDNKAEQLKRQREATDSRAIDFLGRTASSAISALDSGAEGVVKFLGKQLLRTDLTKGIGEALIEADIPIDTAFEKGRELTGLSRTNEKFDNNHISNTIASGIGSAITSLGLFALTGGTTAAITLGASAVDEAYDTQIEDSGSEARGKATIDSKETILAGSIDAIADTFVFGKATKPLGGLKEIGKIFGGEIPTNIEKKVIGKALLKSFTGNAIKKGVAGGLEEATQGTIQDYQAGNISGDKEKFNPVNLQKRGYELLGGVAGSTVGSTVETINTFSGINKTIKQQQQDIKEKIASNDPTISSTKDILTSDLEITDAKDILDIAIPENIDTSNDIDKNSNIDLVENIEALSEESQVESTSLSNEDTALAFIKNIEDIDTNKAKEVIKEVRAITEDDSVDINLIFDELDKQRQEKINETKIKEESLPQEQTQQLESSISKEDIFTPKGFKKIDNFGGDRELKGYDITLDTDPTNTTYTDAEQRKMLPRFNVKNLGEEQYELTVSTPTLTTSEINKEGDIALKVNKEGKKSRAKKETLTWAKEEPITGDINDINNAIRQKLNINESDEITTVGTTETRKYETTGVFKETETEAVSDNFPQGVKNLFKQIGLLNLRQNKAGAPAVNKFNQYLASEDYQKDLNEIVDKKTRAEVQKQINILQKIYNEYQSVPGERSNRTNLKKIKNIRTYISNFLVNKVEDSLDEKNVDPVKEFTQELFTQNQQSEASEKDLRSFYSKTQKNAGSFADISPNKVFEKRQDGTFITELLNKIRGSKDTQDLKGKLDTTTGESKFKYINKELKAIKALVPLIKIDSKLIGRGNQESLVIYHELGEAIATDIAMKAKDERPELPNKASEFLEGDLVLDNEAITASDYLRGDNKKTDTKEIFVDALALKMFDPKTFKKLAPNMEKALNEKLDKLGFNNIGTEVFTAIDSIQKELDSNPNYLEEKATEGIKQGIENVYKERKEKIETPVKKFLDGVKASAYKLVNPFGNIEKIADSLGKIGVFTKKEIENIKGNINIFKLKQDIASTRTLLLTQSYTDAIDSGISPSTIGAIAVLNRIIEEKNAFEVKIKDNPQLLKDVYAKIKNKFPKYVKGIKKDPVKNSEIIETINTVLSRAYADSVVLDESEKGNVALDNLYYVREELIEARSEIKDKKSYTWEMLDTTLDALSLGRASKYVVNPFGLQEKTAKEIIAKEMEKLSPIQKEKLAKLKEVTTAINEQNINDGERLGIISKDYAKILRANADSYVSFTTTDRQIEDDPMSSSLISRTGMHKSDIGDPIVATIAKNTVTAIRHEYQRLSNSIIEMFQAQDKYNLKDATKTVIEEVDTRDREGLLALAEKFKQLQKENPDKIYKIKEKRKVTYRDEVEPNEKNIKKEVVDGVEKIIDTEKITRQLVEYDYSPKITALFMSKSKEEDLKEGELRKSSNVPILEKKEIFEKKKELEKQESQKLINEQDSFLIGTVDGEYVLYRVKDPTLNEIFKVNDDSKGELRQSLEILKKGSMLGSLAYIRFNPYFMTSQYSRDTKALGILEAGSEFNKGTLKGILSSIKNLSLPFGFHFNPKLAKYRKEGRGYLQAIKKVIDDPKKLLELSTTPLAIDDFTKEDIAKDPNIIAGAMLQGYLPNLLVQNPAMNTNANEYTQSGIFKKLQKRLEQVHNTTQTKESKNVDYWVNKATTFINYNRLLGRDMNLPSNSITLTDRQEILSKLQAIALFLDKGKTLKEAINESVLKAGNPDSAGGGSWARTIDPFTMFLRSHLGGLRNFSNIISNNSDGRRSALITSFILNRALNSKFTLGTLAYLAYSIAGADDEEKEIAYKNALTAMESIPNYIENRNIVVPIGVYDPKNKTSVPFNEKFKSWYEFKYLKIPFSFEESIITSPLNGIFNGYMNEGFAGLAGSLVKSALDIFSPASNPVLKATNDILSVSSGTNPIDTFTGKQKFNKKEFDKRPDVGFLLSKEYTQKTLNGLLPFTKALTEPIKGFEKLFSIGSNTIFNYEENTIAKREEGTFKENLIQETLGSKYLENIEKLNELRSEKKKELDSAAAEGKPLEDNELKKLFPKEDFDHLATFGSAKNLVDELVSFAYDNRNDKKVIEKVVEILKKLDLPESGVNEGGLKRIKKQFTEVRKKIK